MPDTIAIDETDRLISSEKVDGTRVYDLSGEKLGTVKSFMVDKRSGKAEYAILEFGGFLGIGSDYYPIPWDMLTYDTSLGGYAVDIDKSLIENAPHYAEGSAPIYDEVYARQVYGYWNYPYPLT